MAVCVIVWCKYMLLKPVEKIEIWLKLDTSNRHFAWTPTYIYDLLSLLVVLWLPWLLEHARCFTLCRHFIYFVSSCAVNRIAAYFDNWSNREKWCVVFHIIRLACLFHILKKQNYILTVNIVIKYKYNYSPCSVCWFEQIKNLCFCLLVSLVLIFWEYWRSHFPVLWNDSRI
jgi:hypothetical protein